MHLQYMHPEHHRAVYSMHPWPFDWRIIPDDELKMLWITRGLHIGHWLVYRRFGRRSIWPPKMLGPKCLDFFAWVRSVLRSWSNDATSRKCETYRV